jgi:hypothetical protein
MKQSKMNEFISFLDEQDKRYKEFLEKHADETMNILNIAEDLIQNIHTHNLSNNGLKILRRRLKYTNNIYNYI